ncbi:MAG: hypothetical protein KKE86_09195 [Planctomycetes bacterium]|nr:hypothetical protein [Planctomycetota bacterium]
MSQLNFFARVKTIHPPSAEASEKGFMMDEAARNLKERNGWVNGSEGKNLASSPEFVGEFW